MHQLLKFIFLLLFPVTALAQQVPQVFQVYDGQHELQLPDSVQKRIQSDTVSSHKKEILLQWFASEGYLKGTIDSLQVSQASVTRNCPFQLHKMNVRYSGEADTVITKEINISYTAESLQDVINGLLLEFVNEGYLFANAEIKELIPDYDSCSLRVEVEIEKGRKAKSTEIYFSGSDVNSNEYLKRIARFLPGVNITPQYLKFLRRNLNASELFNYVSEGQILIRDEEPVIVFEVQERSMNLFDGLLGYVPDAAGNGQIVGDFELSLWNVLAQGNGLNFEYQRLRPETSELKLNASQDWIGNTPIGLSAGFQIYQNDTTYQSREIGMDGYYRISGGLKITGGIGYEATTSGTSNSFIIEPDGRKRTANLGFEFSSLDNFEVPTSGNRIRVSYRISNKKLEEDSTGSFVQNSLEMEAQQYFPLFERSVIVLTMQAFILEADRQTINDLKRFGGANSFRGYAEEQFRAGRLLWGDVEYRFLLNRSSFLFAFGAVGGYHRPKLLTEADNSFQITDYLFSTGFGLSYQTQIGRVKFTYAISPEESVANGKVHFGIITRF